MTDTATPDAPTGRAAVEHVASSATPDRQTAANALAYFMGDEPPPGSTETFPLWVDFGTADKPNPQRCVFRALANEQFVAAAEAALVDDAMAPGGKRVDPFANWSFAVAYAIVEPDLAVVLAARQTRGDTTKAGKPFTNQGELVAEVFRWQAGVLRALMNKLDKLSRLDDEPESLVRQIEAGKDSP